MKIYKEKERKNESTKHRNERDQGF